MNGVILVLLILCKMKDSRNLLLTSKYFQEHHLRGWVKLFESMLIWRWWLKLPSVPMSKIQASEYSTHKLLILYCSIVKWKHGSKLLVIKFHLCLQFGGCKGHKRITQTGENVILCAHPSWGSGRSWHDWALFCWTHMDGMPMLCVSPTKLLRSYCSRRRISV